MVTCGMGLHNSVCRRPVPSRMFLANFAVKSFAKAASATALTAKDAKNSREVRKENQLRFFFRWKQHRRHYRNQQHSPDHPQRDVRRDGKAVGDQHLQADQNEQRRQPVMQEAENLDQLRDGEIHRPQAHDREDIRSVDNECVQSNRKHSRNGIDRKQQIGGFDDDQDHKQRRRIQPRLPAPVADKELVPLVGVGHRDPLAQRLHRRICLRVDLMFAHPEQLEPAANQNHGEDVEHPVKAVDQTNTGQNKTAAQDQRTHDAPEQHSMLLLLRDREVAEDHQKNKEIVDAERKFKNVAGDELQHHLMSLPEQKQRRKRAGQADPQSAPGQRRTRADDLTRPAQDAKVEQQHAQRKDVKENPEEQWSSDRFQIVDFRMQTEDQDIEHSQNDVQSAF